MDLPETLPLKNVPTVNVQENAMKKRKMTQLVVLLLAGFAHAELRFAPVFNDGAVLQCDMPVNIWGIAEPGEKVMVLFAGQEKKAVTSDSGRWQVVLDPMDATMEPRELSVHSSLATRHLTLSNVVVGEVWLATGQSNMVMPLHNTIGGQERLKLPLPNIRFVKVPQRTGLPVEKEYTPQELAWKTFEPPANAEIAAVAFYFAEQIQQKTGRLVGVIQSSYGGTPCEAWTPAWALAEKPELAYLADEIHKGVSSGRAKDQWLSDLQSYRQRFAVWREWLKTKNGPRPEHPGSAGPGNPWSPQSPAVLYENMIAPLVPYTARGVIWYQGESNVGKADEYRVLFPTMIETWREVWSHPDWPFFFVQLAAFSQSNREWPELRAAQTFVRDTVKNTGMAVAIDCGDKTDIHPRNKQPVGERLALLALHQVYGKEVVSRGPCFSRMTVEDGKIRVTFNYVAEGLRADGEQVAAFEIAGEDGVFYPADVKIILNDTVEVSSPAVNGPVSIRYAWKDWIDPPVNLRNSAGLPAEPFLK